MPTPLSGSGRADLHLGQGSTLRPDTLMQTAQISSRKLLADGAGHTFAPCPWRWTLTMVASTMAYSMSGWSETASKSRLNTSPLTQSRYRLKTVFQGPNAVGRSRHGLPVRAIHNTASIKRRLSSPLRPGAAFL